MEKRDQTDYAAAYRQYCNYSRPNQSMKSFCEEQNFNYAKFRRYVDKAFWTESRANRDAIGCHCIPVEIEKPDESTVADAKSNPIAVDNIYAVLSLNVEFSNGLHLSMGNTTIDEIIKLLNKFTA